MSREYEQPGERSWCTDYVFQVLELAKGHTADSLSLLKALLSVEGSVVHEAFSSLELDLPELCQRLGKLRKEAGGTIDEENWIVGRASKRAKAEGFPLSTDHILEVIWDDETLGSQWLSELVHPERLERALNAARYPAEAEAPHVDVPWGPGPGPKELPQRTEEPPRSH